MRALAVVDHNRRRREPADHDAQGVQVIEHAGQVAGELQDGGNGPGTSGDGVGQALALDPFHDPIRPLVAIPRREDRTECGMVQLGEQLALSFEPPAAWRVRLDVDPKADVTLEHDVTSHEQAPGGRRGHELQDLERPHELALHGLKQGCAVHFGGDQRRRRR